MYTVDIINIDHKIVSIHFVSLSNYTIKSVKSNLYSKINHSTIYYGIHLYTSTHLYDKMKITYTF